MRRLKVFLFIQLCTVMVAASSYKVLLTGFPPFRNYTDNPSQYVAQTLDGTCHTVQFQPPFPYAPVEVCFDGIIIGVNHTGASVVENLLMNEETRIYDAVVHMGLEDSAKGLKIEIAAANILAEAAGTAIIPGAPPILPLCGDVTKISLAEFVQKTGTSSLWSRDAGQFYCNETFYRTVFVVRSKEIGPKSDEGFKRFLPVVFVHLPDPGTLSPDVDVDIVVKIAGSLIAASFSL